VPADAALLTSSNLMATNPCSPVNRFRCASARARVRRRREARWRRSVQRLLGNAAHAGQGLARVVATACTRRSADRQGVADAGPELSMIQRETRRAVLFFAVIGMALCVLVTVLYGLMRGDWLNGLLAGITLAMANLPESSRGAHGIPGAWRVADFATRRADPARPGDRDAGFHDGAVRRQDRYPYAEPHGRVPPWVPGSDAVDLQALRRRGFCRTSSNSASWQANGSPSIRWRRPTTGSRGSAAPASVEKLGASTLAHSYPLSPVQLSVAHVWQPQGSDGYVGGRQRRPGGDRGAVRARWRPARGHQSASPPRMSATACACLAVGRGMLPCTPRTLIRGPRRRASCGLHFVGLTGLADPIRPTVPAALRECYAAGIRT
jgi:Ca2+-transporting ATPase